MIKKILTGLGTILTVILTVLATLLCFSVKWMFHTWSNLTMDELVYHLTAPLEGTNEGMIKAYLNECVVPAILMLMLMVLVFIVCRGKKKYFVAMGVAAAASVIAAALAVYGAWQNLDAGGYMEAQGTYSTFVDENYVSPADVELTFPDQKRNLIYIFLESMETTYADEKNGGAFEKNIIPELTKLAQENEDFSGEDEKLNGGYAMPGTTWTMGAMFAQTSGLPLNISIDGNDMGTQDAFFGGAITLGDILKQEGYSQTLLLGSDATFGGRKMYFTEHGDYEILDYNYAIESGMLPADYRAWWGYEDEKLFGFAKEKLQELSKQEQPFNLTMLTVDTHFEDGYVCELCPDTNKDNQYANVMACSSRQVKSFVEWIQRQDFYENTAIVLVGDHPTMDSDFCEEVEDDYGRRVYTSYINAAHETQNSTARNYTTFDSLPTTLDAMGAKIQGDRLGLGTNLFSGEQTLTEGFGIEEMSRELDKKSKLMETLADLDETKPALTMREGKAPTANVWADAYQFETGALPVLVTGIANVPDTIETVTLAVWTEADQSDLQWMQMEPQEDGSYFKNINVPNFNYKVGEYHIQAYIVDGAGTQYMAGETIGIVD